MINVLGGSGFGSSPSIQGSSTPTYQTPSFPVHAYYRASTAWHEQMQGLSQIREDVPEEHTPEAVEDLDEDGSCHPYSQAETVAIFEAWISTSNDPILGNQINRKALWEKVTKVYNRTRLSGTFSRNLKMLRAHFERADRDVENFVGSIEGKRSQWSRHSETGFIDVLIRHRQRFQTS